MSELQSGRIYKNVQIDAVNYYIKEMTGGTMEIKRLESWIDYLTNRHPRFTEYTDANDIADWVLMLDDEELEYEDAD